MAEERTYRGQIYRREGPGDPWVRVDGAQPQRQGGFIPDPYAASNERRREEDQAFEAQRLANEAERLRLAQEAAERAAAESGERRTREQRESAAKEADRLRVEAAQAAGVADSIYQMRNVINAAKQAKERSSDFFATGFGASTAAGWGGTSASDVQALLNTIGSNTAFDRLQRMREQSPTGGALGAVSERELSLLRDTTASIDQSQSDEQFRSNMDKIIEAYQRAMGKLIDADRYYKENGSMDGYTPPDEDRISAIVNQEIEGGSGFTPPAPAGYGATQEGIPVDPAYQAAYAGYIRDNWGNIDEQDLVRFRSDLDRQFRYEPDVAAYAADAEKLNSYAQQGITPDQVPGIAPINQDLNWLDQARNNAVSNPWGAGAAGFANAGGFGIPSLFAGDQYEAMRGTNPIASTVGEIGGGVTGALTGGGLLGQFARGVGNPRAASLLANPITADVGYGGIYGATQADDPLYGAAGGVAGALAGNYIGSQIGRRLPGAVGLRRPQDPLNSGERAVVNSGADMDSVAAALAQADSMGVPMTGADTAPELLSLAGAATRFSPTAGGTARNVMQERNLGQLGRYRQAIERDLGPISNIPQRSEDLIQQARRQAGPLYEQAYAAPGASSVQIDDLTNRPTFQQALRQAYREVADEGLDPTTLGFDLNDAGEVVLNRVPSWQTLDYVKRGLDNVIEAETDAINGVSSAGRRAVSMKNDLLGRMDSVNPAYAQARAAYAGPAAERQMLREGQLAARESPDQLSLDVASLSPAQREQMQLGFQSQLSSNAGRLRDNSNPWGQLYTDDASQRLGTLYPEDSVANLLAQRDLELQLSGNANRLIGNSMTAERQVADELFRAPPSVAGDVGQGIAETALFGGPWLSAGRGISNRLFRERAQARANAQNMQLADDVAALLLNPSPNASADALADVAARNAAYAQSLDEITNRALVRGGHVGAGVGGSIAGLLAR